MSLHIAVSRAQYNSILGCNVATLLIFYIKKYKYKLETPFLEVAPFGCTLNFKKSQGCNVATAL